jgi:hypothetical protein
MFFTTPFKLAGSAAFAGCAGWSLLSSRPSENAAASASSGVPSENCRFAFSPISHRSPSPVTTTFAASDTSGLTSAVSGFSRTSGSWSAAMMVGGPGWLAAGSKVSGQWSTATVTIAVGAAAAGAGEAGDCAQSGAAMRRRRMAK